MCRGSGAWVKPDGCRRPSRAPDSWTRNSNPVGIGRAVPTVGTARGTWRSAAGQSGAMSASGVGDVRRDGRDGAESTAVLLQRSRRPVQARGPLTWVLGEASGRAQIARAGCGRAVARRNGRGTRSVGDEQPFRTFWTRAWPRLKPSAEAYCLKPRIGRRSRCLRWPWSRSKPLFRNLDVRCSTSDSSVRRAGR